MNGSFHVSLLTNVAGTTDYILEGLLWSNLQQHLTIILSTINIVHKIRCVLCHFRAVEIQFSTLVIVQHAGFCRKQVGLYTIKQQTGIVEYARNTKNMSQTYGTGGTTLNICPCQGTLDIAIDIIESRVETKSQIFVV